MKNIYFSLRVRLCIVKLCTMCMCYIKALFIKQKTQGTKK